MAELVVMLFMLARVVSFLSKGQKAYQQVVVRESAYWALVHAIDAAHEQREPPGGERQRAADAVSCEFDGVSYAHGAAQPHPREHVAAHSRARPDADRRPLRFGQDHAAGPDRGPARAAGAGAS